MLSIEYCVELTVPVKGIEQLLSLQFPNLKTLSVLMDHGLAQWTGRFNGEEEALQRYMQDYYEKVLPGASKWKKFIGLHPGVELEFRVEHPWRLGNLEMAFSCDQKRLQRFRDFISNDILRPILGNRQSHLNDNNFQYYSLTFYL